MEKFDSVGALTGPLLLVRSLNEAVSVNLEGADELGLKAGEVVPLVTDGDRLLFQVDGRWFELNAPPQSPLMFSNKRFLKIAPQSAESAVTFRPAAAPQSTDTVALSKFEADASSPPIADAHGAAAMPALRRLLAPEGAVELLRWASRLSILEPFMGVLADPSKLTPAVIRRAFEASGLFFEKKLAKRGTVDGGDLKSLLTRLLAETTDPVLKEDLGQALSELGSVQAQMMAAEASGQRFLALALPLKDDPPVILNLYRPATAESAAPAPIVVDMYLNSASVGNLWCRTVCEADGKLSVTICARDSAIVNAARQFAAFLRKDLSSFGLILAKFSAYVSEMSSDAGAGAGIDLRA